MSSRAPSMSKSTSTYIDESKLHDTSNGTKYESYPNKNRHSNTARLHVESQNEGVVSALATLQSKLLLHDENDYAQSLKSLYAKPNPKLSTQDLPWNQELTDVESKCNLLQRNLLDILKVIQSEEKSDVMPLNNESVHITKPRPTGVMKLRSMKLQPPSNEDDFNCENKHTEYTAKSHQTNVEVDLKSRFSKDPHYRIPTKQLPFVLSGMPGKSFSLPVNIQLLVASLKTHNPWMCLLASDLAAMQELVLQIEKDLEVIIIALKDNIGNLTLESCNMHNKIILTKEMEDRKVQQIMNHRNMLIAQMQRMDTLAKQLHNLKEHLEIAPPAIDVITKSPTSNIDPGATKRKKISMHSDKNRPRKLKIFARKKICNNRPPWNDRFDQKTIPSHRPSVGSIKYQELLQVALKRNGFKVRRRES